MRHSHKFACESVQNPHALIRSLTHLDTDYCQRMFICVCVQN